MNDLAKRLKEVRLDRGMSQAQVSKALGLSRNAYTNYELGLREPSISILKQLCEIFEVSADYLIGLSDSY